MASDAAPAIRLEGLTKRYGNLAALGGVSLEVASGETFGFLGLNGAGKTTTIRIILDLIRPTSGDAFVFGLNCRTRGPEARAMIGYLPGELGFYGDMTGAAALELLARLQDRHVDRQLQRQLMDRLELSPRDLGRKLREYSTGMKRKLGIVQAFQSDAPLLILDEPTEGLDPLMQESLHQLLADTHRRGRTVFMSSHVLHEVERACQRIGLIRDGKLVLISTVTEVRRLAARRVRVTFHENVAPPGQTPDDCEVVASTPRAWDFRVSGPLGPLTRLLSSLPVEDVEVREPQLEEVLRRYYKEETS
jgi:ABC-2 type transport system ATP-binding protein